MRRNRGVGDGSPIFIRTSPLRAEAPRIGAIKKASSPSAARHPAAPAASTLIRGVAYRNKSGREGVFRRATPA